MQSEGTVSGAPSSHGHDGISRSGGWDRNQSQTSGSKPAEDEGDLPPNDASGKARNCGDCPPCGDGWVVHLLAATLQGRESCPIKGVWIPYSLHDKAGAEVKSPFKR